MSSFLDCATADAQQRLILVFLRRPSFRRALYKADPQAYRTLTNITINSTDSKEQHA